jgi:hypothetical protein
VLFVLISRLRIASSSSLSTAEAPCIGVPPVMLIFFVTVGALGAGEEVREAFREAGLLLEDLKSDIRAPAAEGGARGVGACTAAGLESSLKALDGAADEEAVGVGFLEI